MLRTLTRLAFRPPPRPLLSMSVGTAASSKINGKPNGTGAVLNDPRDLVAGPVPFSSRLKEGRALAQDVWSIFKYAHAFPLFWSSALIVTVPPTCLRTVSTLARDT